ncbi:hypothetical protein QUB80_05315 [Chlorogloeopsis sp. ULAP01]|uniref:hypothetical protein n=1 Tax=Chlorogloeopsis sp. ULAP01 TaxID=3056483 RepID=UPI0025AB03AA|nr:hypothetical protein [Chlorogloeopsis sp. ULAP01]MDM9380117.1 hypothetical protein [Chlorogloeopsis sp. ULAP01]
MRVKRVVDAQRAASRRVAPGVTCRRVKRVECDWRQVAWQKVKKLFVHFGKALHIKSTTAYLRKSEI